MRAIFDLSMISLFPVSHLPAVPALVLGAANDQLIAPHEVVATACRLGVTAEILPDMAHLMMLDTHWEEAAKRLEGWLRATWG
jgi:alpha-beta hydrolase superfamily lysophospholipase